MVHKNKTEQQKRRKIQLINKANKCNHSAKGRNRLKKYEKTEKAIRRRYLYRHSTKGKETRRGLEQQKLVQHQEQRRKDKAIKQKEWEQRLQKEAEESTKAWRQLLKDRGLNKVICFIAEKPDSTFI